MCGTPYSAVGGPASAPEYGHVKYPRLPTGYGRGTEVAQLGGGGLVAHPTLFYV